MLDNITNKDWLQNKDKDRDKEESNDFELPDLNYDSLKDDKDTVKVSNTSFIGHNNSNDNKKENSYTNSIFGVDHHLSEEYTPSYYSSNNKNSFVKNNKHNNKDMAQNKKDDIYGPTRPSSSNRKFILVTSFILLGILVCGITFWGVEKYIKDKKNTPTTEVIPEADTAQFTENTEPIVVEEEKKNTVGEILVISEKTGRSYIIVKSFFDEDLANDFTSELALKGISTKIIQPVTSKKPYYRVSVSDYDSYQSALTELEKYKTEYGSDVWAFKY
ncbi:MAG: SPOR domain-containing protein [Chitinophagaceae bacterium]|nr:SPOR domain-containing protein [Chitinophagaceae bacterium]